MALAVIRPANFEISQKMSSVTPAVTKPCCPEFAPIVSPDPVGHAGTQRRPKGGGVGGFGDVRHRADELFLALNFSSLVSEGIEHRACALNESRFLGAQIDQPFS